MSESKEDGPAYSTLPKNESGEPVQIHFKIYFNEIFGVDSVGQQATLTVFFATYWKDDRVIERNPEVEDATAWNAHQFKSDVDPEMIWTPLLELVNGAGGEGISEEAREVVTISGEGAYVIIHNVFRGTVSAPMDLKQFPFDRQVLSLKFRSTNFPAEDCQLVVSEEAKTSMMKNLDDRCQMAEFTIEHVYAVEDNIVYPMLAEIEGTTRATYCEYRVEFLLERKPQYYMDKVWVQFNFITLMDFFCAMLLQFDVGDRNTVALTLFLTAIALSFAVAGDLPKISYRTRMDLFIILNYTNLFIVYLSNFFVYFWYDIEGADLYQEKPSRIQIGFGAVVITMWIITNLWFVFPWFFLGRRPRTILNPNEIQLMGCYDHSNISDSASLQKNSIVAL